MMTFLLGCVSLLGSLGYALVLLTLRELREEVRKNIRRNEDARYWLDEVTRRIGLQTDRFEIFGERQRRLEDMLADLRSTDPSKAETAVLERLDASLGEIRTRLDQERQRVEAGLAAGVAQAQAVLDAYRCLPEKATEDFKAKYRSMIGMWQSVQGNQVPVSLEDDLLGINGDTKRFLAEEKP